MNLDWLRLFRSASSMTCKGRRDSVIASAYIGTTCITYMYLEDFGANRGIFLCRLYLELN